MSSGGSAREQTAEGGEEIQKQAASSRGRTKATDQASPSKQGRQKQAESRSVSRGRTHAKLPPKDRRGRDEAFTEGFVYPGLGGTFVPKDRRATVSEASYLSDAPHLDYNKTHTHKKRRTSGAVKSPYHIRVEMDAMAEIAAARAEASRQGKAAEEGQEKE